MVSSICERSYTRAQKYLDDTMVMMIMMIDKLIFNLFLFRVFSRDVVLGGGEIAFVWTENVRNMQKTNKICYCLGGKFKT